MNALVDRNGPLDPTIASRVLLTLVNVERAPAVARSKSKIHVTENGDTTLELAEPIRLNLHILLTATLDPDDDAHGYAAALGRLSAVIGFLHAAEVMTRQSAPGLPEGIERLVFELLPMDQEGVATLWGALGGGYLPSVLYRVRMVAISSENILGRSAPIVRIGMRTEAGQ